jgi:caffeoyl-CoA O-methyltransferase
MEPSVRSYLLDHGVSETDAQIGLREATLELESASMQISPEQGQFLQLLLRSIGAKKVIEVGTFTGYSALTMALALPQDSLLVACDVSDEWTSIGKPFWEQAGVDGIIDLRLGPAVDTLASLEVEWQKGTFDFVFIDADKTSYSDYYEAALRLLRPGGIVAVDNVLWGGRVADASADDADTVAIRALNAKVRDDDRVFASMIPIGDGLTLAQKR